MRCNINSNNANKSDDENDFNNDNCKKGQLLVEPQPLPSFLR